MLSALQASAHQILTTVFEVGYITEEGTETGLFDSLLKVAKSNVRIRTQYWPSNFWTKVL